MQHTTMSVGHILTIAIICCLLAMASAAPAIAGSQQQQELQPPPLCEPGVIEEMPKHIRNVCLALENNDKLSFVLNSYLRNEASGKCVYIDDSELILFIISLRFFLY